MNLAEQKRGWTPFISHLVHYIEAGKLDKRYKKLIKKVLILSTLLQKSYKNIPSQGFTLDLLSGNRKDNLSFWRGL